MSNWGWEEENRVLKGKRGDGVFNKRQTDRRVRV